MNRKRIKYKNIWPIDERAAKAPQGWNGWPDGKKFALVLMHDVDTAKGQAQCCRLMELEKSLGFHSSFNFVPERYQIQKEIRDILFANNFEVGVHGLKHDGKLFLSRKHFDEKAPRVNQYIREWGVRGFSSPSMLRNLEWMLDLDIDFSTSSFDTDPFEPQPEGMHTIFPFLVSGPNNRKGYVEMPYTLVQDFTLFVIMREKDISIWKRKLDWIAHNGGMALLNTHPDYMNFENRRCTTEEYPVRFYEGFLKYLAEDYKNKYWHPLPGEMAAFWRSSGIKSASADKLNEKVMNVCMLVWNFYDVDARVRKYCEALVEKNISVDVFSMVVETRKKIPFTYTLNGVMVHAIGRKSSDKKFTKYLSSMPLFFFISFLFCTRFFIKKRYDIIHVHSLPDFEVFAALIPKLFGAKVILDIHDPVPDFYAAKFGKNMNHCIIKILKILEKVSTKYSDHVITVTDYWRDVIRERSNIPAHKISVIVNVPDLHIFQSSQPEPKETGTFSLLYPGTINKHCGLDIAVRAIDNAKKHIPSLKFLIYGKGTEFTNIRNLVTELHLEDIVSFHEPVPLHQVPALMQKADVGIALLAGNNSYAQQALNVKLFEYLAMGLPVICTRTPSTEYYLNENAVIFSKINDPDDVARCIVELYNNPAKRKQLSESGLEFVKNFNWNQQKIKYFEIIDNLMK